MSKTSRIRWLYLLLGSVAMLFSGILYAWSILKAPLSDAFGWSASSLSVNFTLTMCFFCLGGVLGGLLTPRLGFRPMCILGGLLAGGGFLLVSTLNGSSIALLYLDYGILGGFGIGIAYNTVISTVSAWFPDKKGLCSGVLMMGFGASSLLLGKAADALIASAADGWRLAFRLLGIALFAVLLLSALLIRRVSTVSHAASHQGKQYPVSETLRTSLFWRAFLLITFLAAVGNTVISMARDLALSVSLSASAATTLVGALAICNGLGRILTGALYDRCGRRTTMLCANLLTLCAAAVTLLAVYCTSAPLCTAGLCLVGLSYGTCPTIASAFTAEVFGTRYFAQNFSVMNCNLILASFLATGTSLLTAATGSYTATFALLLGLTAVALLLNLSLKDR